MSNCLNWVRNQPRIVTVSALLLVLILWGFLELAEEVFEGETHHFDEWLLRSLRQADDPGTPIGPVWLKEVARDVTALGSPAVLSLFTVAVAGYLYLDRKRHLAGILLTAVVTGVFLTFGLKSLFDRPRPDIVPHLSEVYSRSFPSGHSMMSAVVYLTLGILVATVLEQPRLHAYVIGLAVVLTLAVGMTRVYLGVHYPTDVLAGWAAGFAWALACRLVVRQLQRTGHVERDASDSHAPAHRLG
jgi:undecaprenyl-diphosphatase